jgi:hypothetical protein
LPPAFWLGVFLARCAARGSSVCSSRATASHPLPHEHQFNLDNEAGRLALDRSMAFLTRQIKQ